LSRKKKKEAAGRKRPKKKKRHSNEGGGGGGDYVGNRKDGYRKYADDLREKGGLFVGGPAEEVPREKKIL